MKKMIINSKAILCLFILIHVGCQKDPLKTEFRNISEVEQTLLPRNNGEGVSTSANPVGFYFTNCGGEDIIFPNSEGEQRFVWYGNFVLNEARITPSEISHILTQTLSKGTGYGSVTGNKYLLRGTNTRNSHENTFNENSTFIYRVKVRIIGIGNAPSFDGYIQITQVINSTGEVILYKVEFKNPCE